MVLLTIPFNLHFKHNLNHRFRLSLNCVLVYTYSFRNAFRLLLATLFMSHFKHDLNHILRLSLSRVLACSFRHAFSFLLATSFMLNFKRNSIHIRIRIYLDYASPSSTIVNTRASAITSCLRRSTGCLGSLLYTNRLQMR